MWKLIFIYSACVTLQAIQSAQRGKSDCDRMLGTPHQLVNQGGRSSQEFLDD